MRMVMYGAGAIGGFVGAYLWLAKNDVVFIDKSVNQVKAINENGLRFVTLSGTHIVRIKAVTGPEQIAFTPDDIVCLCVKGQNTEEALRDLKAVAPEVPVMCFQNGVRNEEIAARYFAKVYGAMVKVGVVYLTDGEVKAKREIPGWFVMGKYPNGTDDLVVKLAEILRKSGFGVMVTEDMMAYKLGKLYANLDNAIDAITNARGEDWKLISQAAKQEFHDLLTQAGISWKSHQQLEKEWPEMAVEPAQPDGVQTSTWQSLTRKAGSVETEFLNGEAVRLAGKLGKRAPVNDRLNQITQEMAANSELPGKYTPAQLRALLGL